MSRPNQIFNDYNLISEILKILKDKNKRIVFTNGCFDIIHRGHIEYLEKAKSYGDILVVGINSDESVKKIKGRERPINRDIDRAYVVLNLKPVDFVCIFSEETPYELIKKIQPDILVKGGDYSVDNVVGRDVVEKNGGKVVIVDYLKNYSTTEIIRKCRAVNEKNEKR